MIENLPLFNAMNECEVKPPFPHPHRPLTSQESHFAIMEKVNACISEVNHFEQRVKCTIDDFMDKSTTENQAFKEAIQSSYNAFQEVVQKEINNFEQEMKNDFTLFSNDVDLRIADFETSIEKEFLTLQTNLLEVSNEKIEEMNTLKSNLNKGYNDFKASTIEIVENFKTQVNNKLTQQDNDIIRYKNYMVDNILESTETIFEQKAENGEIEDIMRNVYGEESIFLGSKTYDEIQADTTAVNGAYYYCTTDEHYYKRSSTAWVDIGNKDRISDDYEAYKYNQTYQQNSILKTVASIDYVATGKGVINEGGIVADATDTGVTDFIKVIPNKYAIFKNVKVNGKRAICGYDKNKNFVASLKDSSALTDFEIKIPNNVYYVRVNGDTTSTEKPIILTNQYASEDVKFIGSDSIENNFNKQPVITNASLYFETDTSLTTNHGYNVWLKECENVAGLKMKIEASDSESTSFTMRFFVSEINDKSFTFFVLGKDSSSGQWRLTPYTYDFLNKSYTGLTSITINDETIGTNTSIYTLLDRCKTDMVFDSFITFNNGVGALYIRHANFVGYYLIAKFDTGITGKIKAGWNLRTVDERVKLTTFEIVNKIDSPFIHFSIDDINVCLKDLQTNSTNYTSIFDSPYFAKLLDLHLKYGCVFSLYAFNESTDFNISTLSIPATFKNEFANCSSWLKFGVHSKSSGFNMQTQTDNPDEIAQIYNTGKRALINISSRDNIDNVPRFENFGISKEGLKNLQNYYDVVGTLTADDEREVNAGLNATERSLINSCDEMCLNGLYYFKTTTRLDSKTEEEIKELVKNELLNFPTSKNLLFFLHEGTGTIELNTTYLSKFEVVAEYLKYHNYKYDYPQNNLQKYE